MRKVLYTLMFLYVGTAYVLDSNKAEERALSEQRHEEMSVNTATNPLNSFEEE